MCSPVQDVRSPAHLPASIGNGRDLPGSAERARPKTTDAPFSPTHGRAPHERPRLAASTAMAMIKTSGVASSSPNIPMRIADIDAGIAECDDVGGAVAVDVSEVARKAIVAKPAAGSWCSPVLWTLKNRSLEGSVAVAVSDIDSVRAKADDVRVAVAVDVGDFAWKQIS